MAVTKRKVSLGKDATTLGQALHSLAGELRTGLPERVTTRIAVLAKSDVEANLSAIPNVDGNARGEVRVELNGRNAVVVNEGPQVAYLEFGTGATGAASPHPRAPLAPYEYGSRLQWVYFNKMVGGFRTSHGLPPQMQVYNAALSARLDGPIYLAREVRKAVKAL